ncbi:MAG: hypothetical protein R6X02_34070 [Enhygromyxa sp.]
MTRARSIVCFAALLAGCQQVQWSGGDDYDDWQPPDDSSLWQTTGEPVPGEGDGDGDDDDDDDGDGEPPKPKLDSPDHSGLAECSLVDLLFVIDNSNSMIAEQANLIASFDGFIEGIQTNLDEVNDYHIGVVTTDAYALNHPDCRELGALVTESAAGVCGPWAEGRYISLADELASSFKCAADVGPEGDTNERQIEAALRAIGPELAAAGACNEGFIRDEALLVLVLITDEDDPGSPQPGQGSAGGPSSWFAEFVERKGVETNVVALALAGRPPPNACNNDEPFEGAQLGYRIEQLVERFTYGEMGDVCADDYSGFFAGALALIHDACINFTPEG